MLYSILILTIVFICVNTTQIGCPTNVTCFNQETCCQTTSGLWACCPIQDGICCDDGLHCCSKGQICLPNGNCSSSSIEYLSSKLRFDALKNINLDENVCPDGNTCPDENTCCQLASGQYGCCPIANAVCCSDHLHCCPMDYECEPKHGRCKKKHLTSNGIPCPDGNLCPDGETCCLLESGDYGCCPSNDAVCCNDSRHCCPHGYQCDIEKSKCVRDISIPWLTKRDSIRANYQDLVKIRLDTKMNRLNFISSKLIETNHLFSSLSTIICPDTSYSCPDDSTCCPLNDTSFGCCPFPDATCCSDQIHCCPNGYTCDQSGKRCARHLNTLLNQNHNLQSNNQQWPSKIPIKYNFIPLIFHREQQTCPDGKTQCSLTSTCCPNANTNPVTYSCCPYPKGVCCGNNGSVCCPHNYACDTRQLSCQLQSTKTLRSVYLTSDYHQCGTSDVACYSDQTCCRTFGSSDGEYACCGSSNAQCCEDGRHCCPSDSICDVRSGGCVQKYY